MKKVIFVKIISICLAVLMLTLFCGCRKNGVGDSSLSSEYVSMLENVDEQYYSLVQADGSVVILDESNNVVEGAVINDDGSVTITNQEDGKTKTVPADKIKEFDVTIGGTVENITPTVTEKENKKPSNNNYSASDKKNNATVAAPSVPNNTPASNSAEATPSTSNPPAEETATELTPLTAVEIKQVEDYFFQLVNEERARVGVQPLTRNATLDKAAKIRVDETLINFSHTRPNGRSYSSVLTDVQYGIKGENIWSDDGVHWNTEIEYSAGAMGEILTGAGTLCFSEQKNNLNNIAKEMFDAYKNSPAHYNSMISKLYNFMGVAVISYQNEAIVNQHNLTIFTEK